jgi:Phage derived protein Gp49-like (DUF891)
VVNQLGKSLESTLRGTVETDILKRIPAVFFRTESGAEPVRKWLRAMEPEDRRLIGEDIRTVEFGWPIGMPTCRPMGDGLHEIRTHLPYNRIARVFFYVDNNQKFSSVTWASQKDARHPQV